MKEKLLLDLDDTLCVGAMKELAEDYLGKEFDMNSLKPGTYINQKLDCREFRDFFKAHNIYDYGETETITIEYVKILANKYDVYIASTYCYPETDEYSEIMLPRKLQYLKKYFSFLGEKKFLFVGDKKVLDFDISIGDSLSDMIGKKQNFLITRHHNKHYTKEELLRHNAIRVSSWKEIMNKI